MDYVSLSGIRIWKIFIAIFGYNSKFQSVRTFWKSNEFRKFFDNLQQVIFTVQNNFLSNKLLGESLAGVKWWEGAGITQHFLEKCALLSLI